MRTFVHESAFGLGASELWNFHARPGAFALLSPPWQRLELESWSDGIRDGSVLRFVVRAGPGGVVGVRWEALHHGYVEGSQFCDEQVRGPFAYWYHRHVCKPGADLFSSVLRDEIQWAAPGGWLGDALGGGLLEADLRRLFVFRHARTREVVERQCAGRAALAGPGGVGGEGLCVAVTGASGLVGREVVAFLLNAGCKVVRLVRRGRDTRRENWVGLPSGEVEWDPAGGSVDSAGLDAAGVNAVVHLAGAGIADGRWTRGRMREIEASRVRGTQTLVEGLLAMKRRPAVLVSASGSNYYAPGATPVDEQAGAGTGFLSTVAAKWEAATVPVEEAGMRVCRLRMGVVLSARGGMLGRMAPAFMLGLGAKVGRGDAVFSWMSRSETVGVIWQALWDVRWSGAINTVAPHPVSHGQFADTLAAVLRRPRVLRAPGWALRAAVGKVAGVMLESNAVRPGRLEAWGYRYAQPRLESALRAELGRLVEAAG
ncbi:MAG: TIGR01777 family protein [Phycisphaerales bacterium]|nr:TIGR01777 family protein [Phycisphaerales bacterium]